MRLALRREAMAVLAVDRSRGAQEGTGELDGSGRGAAGVVSRSYATNHVNEGSERSHPRSSIVFHNADRPAGARRSVRGPVARPLA